MMQKWERSRAQIGGQWAWLRHRITDLNKQISQLDNMMQVHEGGREGERKEARTGIETLVLADGGWQWSWLVAGFECCLHSHVNQHSWW